jgi:hypothetical protein
VFLFAKPPRPDWAYLGIWSFIWGWTMIAAFICGAMFWSTGLDLINALGTATSAAFDFIAWLPGND